MKQKILLFLAVVGMISLASCKNDSEIDNPGTTDPTDPGDPITDYVHVCDSLTHVEGVEPTFDVDGVYEHWHCYGCNKDYVDEAANVLFCGNTLRPSKCHQIPDSILNKCNASMLWSDELVPQSGGTRVGAMTIIKGIISIASSVSQSKYKHDRQNDLENIQSTLSDITTQLDEIETEIKELEHKTDKILDVVENLDKEAKVNDTYLKLSWLYDKSNKCIKNITKAESNIKSDEDSLFVEICNIIKDWNDFRKNNYDGMSPTVLLDNLMEEFDHAGQDGSKRIPFTGVLKKYTRTYRYWDDDGYYDRMQFMRYYELSASLASYLSSLHIMYVADYASQTSRQTDWEAVIGYTNMLSDSISADSIRMANAYNHYRVFRDSGKPVYLELKPSSGDFTQWWRDHIETRWPNMTSYDGADQYRESEQDEPAMIDHCVNKFIKSFAGDDFLTDDEITYIYKAGKEKGESSLSAIFAKHGLDMNPHKVRHPSLFPMRFGIREWQNTSTAERGEIDGFWCEMKYEKHSPSWFADQSLWHAYVSMLKAGNIWMNFNHSDDDTVHKNTEYDTDWFYDLWTVWDLQWIPWRNSSKCKDCKYERKVNDCNKNAQYVVTFKHYKGELYDGDKR